MRSFDYFATFEESMAIVGDLCAQGFTVIVEPSLSDEPKTRTFDRVNDQLVPILKIAPVFYLSGSFTEKPVQFSRLEEGPGAGKYTIDLLTKGPLIKGLSGRINVVDGANRLLPGRISHQDAYLDAEAGQWEKPSAALKAAFRQVVATVKKRCVRHDYRPGVEIFIGPAALALLKRGEAEIKESHVVPGGKA